MKADGHELELVDEYVKSWAYEKREIHSFDQAYLFTQQLRKEHLVLRNNNGGRMSKMKRHMEDCVDPKCDVCHPLTHNIQQAITPICIGQEICIRVVVRSITWDKDGHTYTCLPVKGDRSEAFNSITIKPTAIVEIGE